MREQAAGTVLVDAAPAAAADPAAVRPARNPLAAGGWSGASFVLSSLIGSLLYLPLARLLDQRDFGLITQANLLYLALVTLAEPAVMQALVQARGDDRSLAHAALWLSTALGLVGAALCLALAPVMVAIYGEPTLLPLLLLMAAGVLASGLGAAPHALLWRELDFRRKTLPEAISVAAGGVVALSAALAGFGVYSLALLPLTQSTVSTAVAWLVVSRGAHRPATRWWAPPPRQAVRRLIGLTTTIGAGDLAQYARINTDYALGGRMLGAASLGVYSVAWSTSIGPQLLISAFTGRVGLAVYARLQHDRVRLRRVFLAVVRLIAVIGLPVSLGALVVAPDLVPVVLGNKWRDVVAPLMVLFVLQLVRTTCGGPGFSVILALGRTRIYAALGFGALPLTALAVTIGARAGVTGVAVAMLCAAGGTSLTAFLIALRLLRVRPRELAGAFGLPLLLGAATVAAVAGARWALLTAGEIPALPRLLAAMLAGLAVFLLLGRLRWRSVRADMLFVRHAVTGDGEEGAGSGGASP